MIVSSPIMARSLFTFLVIITFFALETNASIVIAQSNTNTPIIFPSSSTAMINTFDQTNLGSVTPISEDPNAKYIWANGGMSFGDPSSITIRVNFKIECLNQPLILYITADNAYNFTVNGNSGSGNNQHLLDSYTITTNNIHCNQYINLLIDARNNGVVTISNVAGIKFALISPNCPNCLSDHIFDPNFCQCMPCYDYLPGCLNCTDMSTCTACLNTYFLNGNSCQQCDLNCLDCTGSSTNCISCLEGMYLNSSNSCVYCTTGCMICFLQFSNSICTRCFVGYYLNTSTNLCVLCPNGCINCSSSTVCTNCNTSSNYILSGNNCICNIGFVISGSNCQPCIQTLTGCLTCSSTLICTLCDNLNNFIFSNTGLTCVCSNSYGQFNKQCNKCFTFMPGCLTCLNLSICTNCDNLNNFILIGNNCSCDNGLYLNSFNQCAICNTNCRNCVNSSIICTSCVQGFFLNSTKNCQNCPINCQSCYSLTSCTNCLNSCGNTYFLNTSTCICYSCSIYKSYCLICNVSPILACISCLTNYYLSNGNCNLCDRNCYTCQILSNNCTSCYNGMYLNNNICYNCANGCLSCTSLIACNNCNNTLNFIQNFGLCICDYGYTLNGSNCQNCNLSLVGCISCSSPSVCIFCNFLLNYQLNGTICGCKNTYTMMDNICYPCYTSIQWCSTCTNISLCNSCTYGFYLFDPQNCTEICGDGILFTLQCDDGNIINGDGCSSTCKIQSNYSCSYGSVFSKSICSYNKPFIIILNQISKDSGSNTLYFNFSIWPVFPLLNKINFNTSITTNIQIIRLISWINSNGYFYVSIMYNQNLQFTKKSITFIPPTNSMNNFALVSTTVDVVILPKNNLETTLITPNTYLQAQFIRNIGIALIISILALVIVSLYFSRLIGLQLLSVYQLFFVSIGMLKYIPAQLYPIINLSYIINGYNGQTFSTMTAPLPSTRIQGIQYGSYFLSNANIMVWIQWITLTIFLLIKFLQNTFKYNLLILKYIWHQFTLIIILYNIVNFSYSFGLQIVHFDSDQGYLALNIIIGLFCITIIILTAYYFTGYGRYNEEVQFTKLNPQQLNVMKQKFNVSIYILQRLWLGFYMGCSDARQKMQYILLTIQIIYLLYLLIFQQYGNITYKIGSIIQQLTIFFNFIFVILVNNDYSSLVITNFIWFYFSVFFLAIAIMLYSVIHMIKRYIKVRRRISIKKEKKSPKKNYSKKNNTTTINELQEFNMRKKQDTSMAELRP